MKITSAEKMVRVVAEISTDCGDFRVWPNLVVDRWDNELLEWVSYPDYEDYHEEVKAAGLKVLAQ